MTSGERKRFTLHLQDVGQPLDGDVYVRLRRLLKHALRTLALRCLDVREVPPEPEQRHA